MLSQTTLLKMHWRVALRGLNETNPNTPDSRYWLNQLRLIEQEMRILDNGEVIKGLPTIRREYKISVYDGIEERCRPYPIEYRAECLSGLKTGAEFELMILN